MVPWRPRVSLLQVQPAHRPADGELLGAHGEPGGGQLCAGARRSGFDELAGPLGKL